MNQRLIWIPAALLGLQACKQQPEQGRMEIYQTSAAGDQLSKQPIYEGSTGGNITIDTSRHYQEILGFGGAFTESSAHLLQHMDASQQQEIIQAYFGEEGARYTLCRTHINSCDFSLGHYSYAPVEGDTLLSHFDIAPDRDDIIPMIKKAYEASEGGFRIIASPWTAPPWMKDNNAWEGGRLLPRYYETWALYFSKYLTAYEQEGIDIWGVTVENEPLGNDAHWESMHFTPVEMAAFVKNHLAPRLRRDSHKVKVLVFDQNKGEELQEWAEVLLADSALLPHIYGTAVHWYAGTVDWFPESLQKTHALAPGKHIVHTEACVDSEIPHWRDDGWYWSREATDWGYEWAAPENKFRHPKYVPVYRYARDIIGGLNNWVEGWIDWNMVLDQHGGPNWAENWCAAPVIVDTTKKEVYYTPLYYTMNHFSRYIRPGAVIVSTASDESELMLVAAKNPDHSVCVVVLNTTSQAQSRTLMMGNREYKFKIDPRAIQTILINP